MLVYAGIQYDQTQDSTRLDEFKSSNFITGSTVKSLLIAVICITASDCVFQGFMTYKLYKEFNWDIFKKLGADLRLKTALRDYLLFESVITFDVFFFVGFTLQFIIVVLQTKDVEFALTIAVLPVTIVTLILAVFSVRREFKAGVVIFISLCFPGMAYFLFKLIRLYTATGPKKARFDRAKKTLTVFAVITLCFLIVTILSSIKCLMNFGVGLKDKKNKQRMNVGAGVDMEPKDSIFMNSIQKDSMGPRMVIDWYLYFYFIFTNLYNFFGF